MAITDLTGTKWYFHKTSFVQAPKSGSSNWTFAASSNQSDIWINFTSNSISYSRIHFDGANNSKPGFTYITADYSSVYVWKYGGEGWADDVYRTIEITGGSHATDSKFITWMGSNATQILEGYTVTFEENGGSTVTDLTEQTALRTPLPTTTKANHAFAGWYYDNLFTQKANAGDELTTNVTLYAKWYTPTTWCEDIADAIREKDGTTAPIKHLDFPDKIKNIQGAKPEETKSVTPNFASGNQIILPTTNKVLSQVTLTKPTDLIPENIAKDKNVCGVVGTSFIAIELTQAQYDALTTKDSNTYYLING